MIRQAVILAAGKGTRLRTSDDDLPKPLHQVGGVSLIKRTITTLARAGVTRVVVVTGFQAELVRGALAGDPDYAAAGVAIEFAHNAEFDKANGVSVVVGAGAVEGPFLISMGDHLYAPNLAARVAAQDMGAADLYLATDTRIDQILDPDDATKVRSDAGRIVEIGKMIPAFDRIDCGVFAVTHALRDALVAVRAAKGDCSLTEGVRGLAAAGRARVVDIADLGGHWQDVDTPTDRAAAEAALAGGAA